VGDVERLLAAVGQRSGCDHEQIMDFAEVLKRRKMVRSYTDEPVERAALDRILDAGRKAPSGGFSQGVRFVVVTEPETRRRIAELAGEEEYYTSYGFEPWISRAPVHIVVAMREDDYHDRYTQADKLEATGGEEIEWRVPWWWVDAGKAIMLLLLASIDEGLGAGLFGLIGEKNVDVRELLGIPEDFEVVGVVTVGHPGPNPNVEQQRQRFREMRRPVEEVVRWERW
jgi:FMN reductase [NAD(P)H]